MPPLRRGARLHEWDAALAEGRQVQRPLHRQVPATMINGLYPFRIGKQATVAVEMQRIVRKALPELPDHGNEFGGTCITLGRRRHLGHAEIAVAFQRRDDVPACAPVA